MYDYLEVVIRVWSGWKMTAILHEEVLSRDIRHMYDHLLLFARSTSV